MKAIVQNINWDTDGKKNHLPETLVVNLPLNITTDNIEEMDDYISDAISNETGFCHDGFTYYLQNL